MNLLFFIQIILELIPISSSGHLQILISKFPHLLPLNFFEEIFAHLATALICGIFFIRSYFLDEISLKKNVKNIFYLFFSTLITAGFIIFDPLVNIKSKFTLTMGLWVTALILFNLKRNIKNRKKYITFFDSILIGIFQSLATFSGISRFAITLFACKLLKIDYKQSFFISLFLNILISLGGFCLLLKKINFNIDIIEEFYKKTLEIDLFFGLEYWKILLISIFISYLLFEFIRYLYFKNKIWYLSFYEIAIAIYSFILLGF